MDVARALLMVMVMCLASLSGCFGEYDSAENISSDSLRVSPSIIPGGEWTTITLKASSDMSVLFMPQDLFTGTEWNCFRFEKWRFDFD